MLLSTWTMMMLVTWKHWRKRPAYWRNEWRPPSQGSCWSHALTSTREATKDTGVPTSRNWHLMSVHQTENQSRTWQNWQHAGRTGHRLKICYKGHWALKLSLNDWKLSSRASWDSAVALPVTPDWWVVVQHQWCGSDSSFQKKHNRCCLSG